MTIHQHKEPEVRRIFRRIHGRYDLLNRLMSLGQDQHWRRVAAAHLDPMGQSLILDIGAGTGDLAAEVLRREPSAHLVALDFTQEMLVKGRARHPDANISWVLADAEMLPFEDCRFHGVISGFLMRNVTDVDKTLQEQHRVLRSDQRMVCLESNPSRRTIFNPLVQFYLRQVIPALGGLLARDRSAYDYLTRSMDGFLSSEELRSKMLTAGFKSLGATELMLGTVAIHWGNRQP